MLHRNCVNRKWWVASSLYIKRYKILYIQNLALIRTFSSRMANAWRAPLKYRHVLKASNDAGPANDDTCFHYAFHVWQRLNKCLLSSNARLFAERRLCAAGPPPFATLAAPRVVYKTAVCSVAECVHTAHTLRILSRASQSHAAHRSDAQPDAPRRHSGTRNIQFSFFIK